MTPDQKTLELIDRYLMNELDAEETSTFEKKMKGDKTFAGEVLLQKKIIDSIPSEEDMQLKSMIAEVGEEFHARSSFKRIRAAIRAIFSIVIIIILAIIIFNLFGTSKNEKLFAIHYKPEGLNLIDRENNLLDFVFVEAITYFDKGDYTKAIEAFTAYTNKENQYRKEAALYIGICYMETEKYNLALESLDINQFANSPILKSNAMWYSALIYLKMNDIKACRALLSIIASDKESECYSLAIDLLDDLDNKKKSSPTLFQSFYPTSKSLSG